MSAAGLMPAQRRCPVSGPKPMMSGSEGVEELGDLGLGFEDAADVRVVEGSEAVALRTWQRMPAFSMARASRSAVVVGADGGLGEAGGDGHGGDHGAVEAKGGLVGGEAFGAFDFVGDVDGFVEGGVEQAEGWAESVAVDPGGVVRGGHAVGDVGFDGGEADGGEVGEGLVEDFFGFVDLAVVGPVGNRIRRHPRAVTRWGRPADSSFAVTVGPSSRVRGSARCSGCR